MSADAVRANDVRAGVRAELFTVIWMVIEAVVSLGAGIIAGSILLTAFGLDSVIELISGSVLLWRLSVEAGGEETERVEQVEHSATWVVAVTLALLCIYVLVSSIYLRTGNRVEAGDVLCGNRHCARRRGDHAMAGYHEAPHRHEDRQ